MTYFGMKVRACMVHDSDIELALMKLFIRRALLDSVAVSYSNRLFLFPSNENEPIKIIRSSEPEIAIEIPGNKAADATDRFIDAFVFEVGSNLNHVVFHHGPVPGGPGNSWQYLKTKIAGISTLLSTKPSLIELLKTTANDTEEAPAVDLQL